MPAPDPASPLARRIRAALRANEIGARDPYRLSYAGLGSSGPSFGIFQADLAANAAARACLRNLLVASGLPQIRAASLASQLGRACLRSPLDDSDTAEVLAALASDIGRQAIDTMDAATLAIVLGYVGRAIDAAASAGLTLDDGAACAVALWANMTGAPNTLDGWLGGQPVTMGGVTLQPPAGPTVTQADLDAYLSHTLFFEQHARNLAHFQASVATGLAAA